MTSNRIPNSSASGMRNLNAPRLRTAPSIHSLSMLSRDILPRLTFSLLAYLCEALRLCLIVNKGSDRLKFLGIQLFLFASKPLTSRLLAFAVVHVASCLLVWNCGLGDGDRLSFRGATRPGELQPPRSCGEGVRSRLMNRGLSWMVARLDRGCAVPSKTAAPEVEPLRFADVAHRVFSSVAGGRVRKLRCAPTVLRALGCVKDG